MNKSDLLNKYINGDISSRVMLNYLQDDDFYNSYYALKMLEAEVNNPRLIPSHREILFNMVLQDTRQSLNYLTSRQMQDIQTEEEKSKALHAVATDYATLEKLMENYLCLIYTDLGELGDVIKNLDRKKALNNREYNDLLIKIAKAIKCSNLDNNIIIDACSNNAELFENCIAYSSFDYNKQYAFEMSTYYFENKAKRSTQKCLDYCCYFEQFITNYHLEFLVKRIQGKKEFGMARDLINKKYTFDQFTSDQLERLESLVIMKELEGGF